MYIEKLAKRTLLLYLRSTPAPQSLRESLVTHTLLQDYITQKGGSLIQYRQSICPVTKVRLPQLRALIEDSTRSSDFLPKHLVWPGSGSVATASTAPDLTQLERHLLDINEVHQHLEVTAMTRDLETLDKVTNRDEDSLEASNSDK